MVTWRPGSHCPAAAASLALRRRHALHGGRGISHRRRLAGVARLRRLARQAPAGEVLRFEA